MAWLGNGGQRVATLLVYIREVAPGFYELIVDLRGYLGWEQKGRKSSTRNVTVRTESWSVLGAGRGAQALCTGPLTMQQMPYGGALSGRDPAPGKKTSPRSGRAPYDCWRRRRPSWLLLAVVDRRG